MGVTRSYLSPLREGQQEQVRARIIEKVREVLADPSVGELSVPEVARRAGVSVRTVYRYFPTKEALIDGWNDSMAKSFHDGKPFPRDLDELPDGIRSLFASFASHAEDMKAQRYSKVAGEVRASRKKTQRRAIAKAISELTRHSSDVEARKVGAIFHNLASSESWLNMVEVWGLESTEAADAAVWAIEAFREKVERERRRR